MTQGNAWSTLALVSTAAGSALVGAAVVHTWHAQRAEAAASVARDAEPDPETAPQKLALALALVPASTTAAPATAAPAPAAAQKTVGEGGAPLSGGLLSAAAQFWVEQNGSTGPVGAAWPLGTDTGNHPMAMAARNGRALDLGEDPGVHDSSLGACAGAGFEGFCTVPRPQAARERGRAAAHVAQVRNGPPRTTRVVSSRGRPLVPAAVASIGSGVYILASCVFVPGCALRTRRVTHACVEQL